MQGQHISSMNALDNFYPLSELITLVPMPNIPIPTIQFTNR